MIGTRLVRKLLWIILGLVSVVIVGTSYVLRIQEVGQIQYRIMAENGNGIQKMINDKTLTTVAPIKLTTTKQKIQKSNLASINPIVMTNKNILTTVKPKLTRKAIMTTAIKTIKSTQPAITTKAPATTITSRKPPTNKLPLILYWTKWYDIKWPARYYGKVKCHNVSCIFSDNKAQYKQADALAFHGSASAINRRGFHPPKDEKPRNQIWVYRNLENPVLTRRLTGKNVYSIHNGVFNVVDSYTRDSMAFSPYAYVIKGNFPQNYDPNKDYGKGKTKLIAWASSQCYPRRTKFVREFSKLIDVDKYGKCGEIKCGKSDNCWEKIAKEHKFYLSFENYICKEYVTEKFYHHGLTLGMVPIVIGGANYSDPSIGPPGSYINALDFRSASDLVKYIKKVANNKTLYNSYFKWKASYKVDYKDTAGLLCQVCQNLYDPQWVKAASKSIVHNLVKDWGDEKKFCTNYPNNVNNLTLTFPWQT